MARSFSDIERIVERYDTASAELDRAVSDRLADSLDASYRNLERELRRLYPTWQSDGSLYAVQRRLLLMEQLGETLAVVRPEMTAEYEALFAEALTISHESGARMADELIRARDPGYPLQEFTTVPIEAAVAQARDGVQRLYRYNDEFKTSVSGVVEQGLLQGWGADKVARMLRGNEQMQGQFGVAQLKSKAETIARTEIMSAFGTATQQRIAENGLLVQVMNTPSERLCSFCLGRHGNVYEVGQISVPFHPRCRDVLLPYSKKWAERGWTDDAAIAADKTQRIEEMAKLGTKPNLGPTSWERRAGLEKAPAPVWKPGDPPPVAPKPEPKPKAEPKAKAKAKPAPEPKAKAKVEPKPNAPAKPPTPAAAPPPATRATSTEKIPKSIAKINQPHYQAAIDGKQMALTDKEAAAGKKFMDAFVPEGSSKVASVMKENPSITEPEARAVAAYITSGFANMSKRFYAPTAKIEARKNMYKAADVDGANKLFGNALRKMPAITEESINSTARAYAKSQDKDPALYDPNRGLTRGIKLSGADLDGLIKKHQDALAGDGTIRQDALFATTTMTLKDVAVARESNVVYRIKPRLDGSGQGRYIDHHKGWQVEGEVMYPAYSQFRVVAVNVKEGRGTKPTDDDFAQSQIWGRVQMSQEIYGRSWKSNFGGKAPNPAQLKAAEAAYEKVRGYQEAGVEIILEE